MLQSHGPVWVLDDRRVSIGRQCAVTVSKTVDVLAGLQGQCDNVGSVFEAINVLVP